MKLLARLMFLLALVFGGACTLAPKAEAQGTPCQWNYTLVNGQAVATYCGVVNSSGGITVAAVSSIATMQAISSPFNGQAAIVSGLQGGTFIASNSACNHAGAGDSGTQFPASGGGCWIRQFTGCADVSFWGADPTDTTDATSAFNTAIGAVNSVCALTKNATYNIAGTVALNSNSESLILDPTVTLHRHNGGATSIVLECLYEYTTCRGGTVKDEAASPNGIVVLGNINQSDTNNAWWWRLEDMNIFGEDTAGNICINVPSGQVNTPGLANYFGTIAHVKIQGCDTGILLSELSNAHILSDLQFWDIRTYALELKGAYGNTVHGMFVHTSAANNGTVGLGLVNETVGTQHSIKNSIYGLADESGTNDKTLFIDTNSSQNTIIGMHNTGTIGTISNANNNVQLDGNINGSVTAQSNAYFVTSAGTAGVSCSGSPTASFASVLGIITHC